LGSDSVKLFPTLIHFTPDVMEMRLAPMREIGGTTIQLLRDLLGFVRAPLLLNEDTTFRVNKPGIFKFKS
jgi:hypothetical protein